MVELQNEILECRQCRLFGRKKVKYMALKFFGAICNDLVKTLTSSIVSNKKRLTMYVS